MSHVRKLEKLLKIGWKCVIKYRLWIQPGKFLKTWLIFEPWSWPQIISPTSHGWKTLHLKLHGWLSVLFKVAETIKFLYNQAKKTYKKTKITYANNLNHNHLSSISWNQKRRRIMMIADVGQVKIQMVNRWKSVKCNLEHKWIHILISDKDPQ